jgi:hypothetical protein
VFTKLYRKLHDTRKTNTIDFVKEEIFKPGEDNPELAKSKQWHFFEGQLFADYYSFLSFDRGDIISHEDLENWLEFMDFANTKTCMVLQNSNANHIMMEFFTWL